MASLRPIRGWTLPLLGSLLAACGGSDDGDDENSIRGAVVAAPWQSYCTATFTRDAALDDFGDTIEVSAGSQFLVADYEDAFGDVRVDLLYVTAGGPYEIELEVASPEDLPFTSNCDLPNAAKYYAVFQDLAVYAEAELATKVCDLSAGSVLPMDGSFTFRASVDFSIDLSGKPQTYEVSLNSFKELCGGGQTGFISVPSTKVLGTTTWLPGIHWILGPAE